MPTIHPVKDWPFFSDNREVSEYFRGFQHMRNSRDAMNVAKRCTCLLGVLLGNAAGAASDDDLTDLPIEQLMKIQVVSASRFAQDTRAAPSAVSVVSQDEIRAHGWNTLAEILNGIKGLYVSNDRSYSYLGVRGFSIPGDYNTRFLLLVDGYRVNDAIYEQAYLGNEFLLDVSSIDRVEFVPGAGSAVYGSNAVLGVINVITRDGGAVPGVTLGAEVGSWGGKQAKVRWGRALEGGGELLLSASTLRNGGQAMDLPGIGPTPAGMDAERADKLYAKWRQGELTFAAAWMQRRKNTPAAPFDTDVGVAGTATTDQQFFASLKHSHDFSADSNLQTQGYYGQSSYQGDYVYGGATERELTDARWWGLESRVLYGGIPDHKLILGLDYQNSPHQALRYQGPPDYATQSHAWHAGLYGQDEWRLARDLALNAGLRFDRYGSFGNRSNPRLALIWNASAADTLKLAYGKAFRAPSAYETHYEDSTSAPNPALRPETVVSTELIAEHALARGKFSGSLYRYRFDDLIALEVDPVSGKDQYRNAGGMRAVGAEIGLEQGFGDSLLGRFSYARQRARDAAGGNPANSPHQLFKAALRANAGAWRPAAELRYVSARDRVDGSVVPAAWLVDLSLIGHNLAPGLTLTASIRNLFDRHYSDPVGTGFASNGGAAPDLLSLPGDGRNFRLKLAYRF
jgi:iron complex outermembrane receptor protein